MKRYLVRLSHNTCWVLQPVVPKALQICGTSVGFLLQSMCVIDCMFWLQSYVEEAPPHDCYSSRAWNLSESITQHMLPGCKGLTGRFTPRCLILKLYIIGAHLNQIEVLFTFLDSSSMKLDWNSGHSILTMKQRMVWWAQLQSKPRSAKGRFQEKRKGSGGGGRLTPA